MLDQPLLAFFLRSYLQLEDLYCSYWPLRVVLDEQLHGPDAAWVRRVWRKPLQEWAYSSWNPTGWREVEEAPPEQLG